MVRRPGTRRCGGSRPARPASVSRSPAAQALLHGGVAAGPAEDEQDRRQQPRAVEPLDDVGARRRLPASRPAAAPAGRGPVGRSSSRRSSSRVWRSSSGWTSCLRAASASWNRSNIRLPTSMCCHSGTGRCSLTTTSVWPRTVTSQSANSSALLTVADSETSVTDDGQVDDHLLPDRAAEPVGEVVHLVHHHVRQAVQGRRAGVEHVAQHLGGHHHHRRVAVDRVVAGQQADLVGAVPRDQVVVLLVGQRLDRRGVEALAALARSARCTANSPTTVLPAPVGAQTSTPLPRSSASQA